MRYKFCSTSLSLQCIILVRPTSTLTATAKAFLEDVLLIYDVPKNRRDACQFLKNGNCPLEAGQNAHYELVAPVDAPIAGIENVLIYSRFVVAYL